MALPSTPAFHVDHDGLPPGDYCAPGLVAVQPDACFPHMVKGNPANNGWRYLRGHIPHNWYVDERFPVMGFMNRDEATLLHNIARQFAGQRALEIGCWMGWSTCHLALAGVQLDVIDPGLSNPVQHDSVSDSLSCAGVRDRVTLHALSSPDGLEMAAGQGQPWRLLIIDGDHEGAAPARDVERCLDFCADDCAFVFHDLTSPDVAEGLRLLEARGFLVQLYQTQQIMGMAWRGAVTPVPHTPDPAMVWELPHHLIGLPVAGLSAHGYAIDLRERLLAQATEISNLKTELASVYNGLGYRIEKRLRG